jgi:hypothetical protein
MIEVSGLTKRYGERTAVDDLTISQRMGGDEQPSSRGSPERSTSISARTAPSDLSCRTLPCRDRPTPASARLVDLVSLARQRRETLDLLRVGDLDRPALLLKVSWTILAPVIDSITAQTGWQWTSSMRRASLLSESTSGGTAS